MKYQLTVSGTPVPQSRPRFTRQGHAYEAAPSREYKEVIKRVAIESKQAVLPDETPLKAVIKIFVPIPKSRAKHLKNDDYCIVKGDTDNYVKTLLDALNGIAYKDDATVAHIDAVKRYTTGEPKAEILIETLDEE